MKSEILSRYPMRRYALETINYLIVIFLVALITFGTRFGFDTTDEAWGLSLVESNRITYAEPWAYQYVLHPFWNLLGQKVIVFRLLRVIGYLASALFLAHAGERFLQIFTPNFPVKAFSSYFKLFAVLGSTWAWIWAPQAFTYNEVSAILGVTLAGLFMLLASSNQLDIQIRYLSSLGFLVALIAPFKYPSCFALSLLVFASVFCLDSLRGKRRVAHLQIAFGGVVALLLLQLLGVPFQSWTQTIKWILTDEQLQKLFSHPIGPIIKANISDLLIGIKYTAAISLIPMFVLLILVVNFSHGMQDKYPLIKVLGFAIPGFTVYFFLRRLVIPNLEWQYAVLKSISGFIGITGLVVFLFVAQKCLDRSKMKDCYLVAIFLFGTPITLAFGTNNPILGQVNYAMAPWYLLYAISFSLLVTKFPGIITETIFATYTLIGIVSTVALVVYGVLVSPYRGSPVRDNASSTSIGALQGILMPAALAQKLDWTYQIGRRPEYSGKDTISISSPALLFAFNNSKFASPWITDEWPISYLSLAEACKISGKPPIILKDAQTPFPDALLPSLTKCGVSSLDQFGLAEEHIGTSGNPDAQIWIIKTK